MDDEREHRQDPDLSAVWQDMTPDERIALMVAEGETPPSGLSQAAQSLASGPA